MQVLHRASQCLINDKGTQRLASRNEHGTENGTHKLLGRKGRANLSDLGEQTWQQGHGQSIAYRSAKKRFNGGSMCRYLHLLEKPYMLLKKKKTSQKNMGWYDIDMGYYGLMIN